MFNAEEFAMEMMKYAVEKAKVLSSQQYADAFSELSRAAEAEHQECLER